MILKYSSLSTPEQGIIHAEGFISPKGEIFDLAADEDNDKPGLRHGDWILENLDWLESQGYGIKIPSGVNREHAGRMSGEVNDLLRDQLVRQGWIHVFMPDMISVWKFNARVEKTIRKLILNQDYYIDEDTIQVYEQSSGNQFQIDLQEEQ